ncbi:MAG TPA: SpaA isopeptide-forming pilin-related protein, partial [Gaiellaceae bacterium]|nr:SpaA isopeptide-forming pilin-related protein [Gaiellaceae bacterium]
YYLANSTAANGDIFLALAWVRIPQNTTSSSAHVGFEFNQGDTPCGAGSDDLVERTEGDLLFVYDFERGSADPRITLREWVTSGACEVGSNSPPCWGPAVDLTAGGFAEAEVNVGTSVLDAVADPDETLNDSEFGEAIINLSDAGVFTPGECVAFGKTFAVSRSSGNSAQAQMKDLVGPADINIQNCGSIIIHKQTVPSPDPTGTSFGYTTTGGLVPSTFSLLDGGMEDFQSPAILAGPYSVTEGDPGPNFVLTAINCTSSGTSTFTTDVGTRTVSIDLDATDTVECTFVNTLQTGAIKITKTRKHAATPGNDAHAGVQFTIGGTAVTTDANGQACVDGLAFGSYDVVETVPAGYVGEGGSTTTVTKSVTVDNTATCAGSPYVGESVSFHNTPLTNITVSVDSQVDGGTASTIDCGAGVVSTGPNGDGSTSRNNLVPGTYTCTIVIDP